ncbi:MAG: ATP-binding cassette domain-containing protein [Cryomorphaceae bacterium]|nr:ATP-binding cassette domain-containing protein [Cryomorphaceae bacterium]
MNEIYLKIDSAVKNYGKNEVLNIPSLEIKRGACFGLVGNNGAGKTTLFRAILDLIQLDNGKVLSKDIQVDQKEEWKRHTGSFLDEGFLIDYLRPDEFFSFVGLTHGMEKTAVAEQLEVFEPFFKDEILGHKKYIRDLSKGNQKKVGIAAAFLGQPEIVLLDEPFANLDPSSQFQLREIIKTLSKERDITMLISSHDLTHVTDVCSRIVILEKGKMVKDLQTNPQTLQELETFFQTI